jgi:tRNA (adenine22-N1)-methyltransferase
MHFTQQGSPLSRRLECVLELLRPCATLVDVGTDHGLLPVAAVLRGVAKQAIAVDLREAPLAGARVHIERMGVAAQVIALKGDGLSELQQHQVEAVVIAGMSGESMLRIFEAAPQVLARVEQVIVQPNQNVHLLRAWALVNGWHLRDERMIDERGQYFVVCAFVPGAGMDPVYTVPGWTVEALFSVGPRLLQQKDEVALRWFERQRTRVAQLVKHDVERLKPELELWEAACKAKLPA